MVLAAGGKGGVHLTLPEAEFTRGALDPAYLRSGALMMLQYSTIEKKSWLGYSDVERNEP